MTNMRFAAITDYRDLESLNGYRELVENQGVAPEAALDKVRFRSRDNARTPMQWDASPGAGFTAGTPWIAINPNHATINVAAERADPASVLNHYRALIALRKAEPVVVHGRYDLVAGTDPRLWAYTRTLGTARLLVMCNVSPDLVPVPDVAGAAATTLILGNYPGEAAPELRPYEARVCRLG